MNWYWGNLPRIVPLWNWRAWFNFHHTSSYCFKFLAPWSELFAIFAWQIAWFYSSGSLNTHGKDGAHSHFAPIHTSPKVCARKQRPDLCRQYKLQCTCISKVCKQGRSDYGMKIFKWNGEEETMLFTKDHIIVRSYCIFILEEDRSSYSQI